VTRFLETVMISSPGMRRKRYMKRKEVDKITLF